MNMTNTNDSDAFKNVFKQFKRKQPLPDLSCVIDFRKDEIESSMVDVSKNERINQIYMIQGMHFYFIWYNLGSTESGPCQWRTVMFWYDWIRTKTHAWLENISARKASR